MSLPEEFKERRPNLLRFFSTILYVLLELANPGYARGITSTFIRSEWPSVDIPLDNEVFAVPKGHNAPQQVHITQGDYDGKAVIISWVTPDKPGLSKVEYGTSEKKYHLSAEGTVTNYTYYKYRSGYIHQCVIDGLEVISIFKLEKGQTNAVASLLMVQTLNRLTVVTFILDYRKTLYQPNIP
uniref:Bifunctional purple acid phosphatase 26-like n=1 Tax=Rhizophora mucronata TaxID=61149 RepID=A0A2P2NZX5_RHIMU